MIDLKTLSVVAAASAALLSFSPGPAGAQAGGSYGNSGSSGSGSGASGVPSGNPSAMPGSGSSPSSGSTARGSDQCAQISDPRARQDCMQRQNDLRSGGSGSGATGNNPIGDGPGITNRGSGSK